MNKNSSIDYFSQYFFHVLFILMPIRAEVLNRWPSANLKMT